MKLSDYVIRFVAEQGVKHVFLVTGGGAMHLNASLGQCPEIEAVCNSHEQASAMAAEYAAKQARVVKLEQRLPAGDGQFSLLAFMEEAAASVQIRDRIVGMQPQQTTMQHGYQETAVDLRLDGVQLPQLLALLVALEQAPYDVQVQHLQIKPKYDNPVNLDATLRIVSYAKA